MMPVHCEVGFFVTAELDHISALSLNFNWCTGDNIPTIFFGIIIYYEEKLNRLGGEFRRDHPTGHRIWLVSKSDKTLTWQRLQRPRLSREPYPDTSDSGSDGERNIWSPGRLDRDL